MYFNDRNEDTNIDSEFKQKKTISAEKLKKILIFGGIALVVFIIVLIIILKIKNKTIYYFELLGDKEVNIIQGIAYNEDNYGYKAWSNKNSNLNSEVVIEGMDILDTETIGTYTITYTFHDFKETRTINVTEMPSETTTINLIGDRNIYLSVGDTFRDPGIDSVSDIIDGAIPKERVRVEGTVDTSKQGVYRIIYSVTNSRGKTTTEERVVEVR